MLFCFIYTAQFQDSNKQKSEAKEYYTNNNKNNYYKKQQRIVMYIEHLQENLRIKNGNFSVFPVRCT